MLNFRKFSVWFALDHIKEKVLLDVHMIRPSLLIQSLRYVLVCKGKDFTVIIGSIIDKNKKLAYIGESNEITSVKIKAFNYGSSYGSILLYEHWQCLERV